MEIALNNIISNQPLGPAVIEKLRLVGSGCGFFIYGNIGSGVSSLWIQTRFIFA